MTRTKTEIRDEAIKKFKRISEKKKELYFNNRKKSIIKLYIALFCISLFLSASYVILAVMYTENIVGFIILGVVSLFVGIAFLAVMLVKLKSPKEKLILQEIEKVLYKTYAMMTYDNALQYKSLVGQHSKTIKNIVALNSKYIFDRKVCKNHVYYEYLSSKRQFDNFNCQKWLYLEFQNRPHFFESLEEVYTTQKEKYEEYSKLYELAQEHMEEKDVEDLEIEFEMFKYVEKIAFTEYKQKGITQPSIRVNYSYTSPSGRNKYSNTHYFSYDQLLVLIEIEKEEREKAIQEKKEKELLAEKKREKERKLRELEKIEKQLSQKAQTLNEKEKEFYEATKEHIYTAKKIEQKNEIQLNEVQTISEKLKVIRTKFDNGEITYEEYKNLRKELM